MKNIYSQGWELCLEAQFLQENRCRKRAYICSPLRSACASEVLLNMRAARAYMFYAAVQLGYLTRAPHACLPMLLCDMNPGERKLALSFGLALLECSDVMLVCGDRISEGMAGEIARAAVLGLEIHVFYDGIYSSVKRIVRERGGDTGNVLFKRGHPLLSLPAAEICMWAYASADKLANEG